MKYTVLIEEGDRKLTVNTCDMYEKESEEMQLVVMQHDDESYIDLSREEAFLLLDKLNEWLM